MLGKLFGRLQTSAADDALGEIAERLKTGDVDPVFLQILAQMIDPKSDRHIFAARFALVRTKGARRPLEPVDWDLANFLDREIERGEKADAVFALAKEKFGVGRTKCTQLLAKARESREMRENYAELVRLYG